MQKTIYGKFIFSAKVYAAILALMLSMLTLGASISGIPGDLMMIIFSSIVTLFSLACIGYGFYVQNELKNQF
ncbi:hypothetical protein [Planococcus sp. NCCP-2050]|uniref:hypothetical protein n=1 Tax=Planococcus sp. NCCP-2050 TaxID=2944679 RepID=UPI00203C7215|nr:hypothetical protein [Planococcus sp. NCCP-2050]GKW46914.1 hypothetical protein NCCP2050_26060 [Planococcus sp. NCCP-2050]